MLRRRAAWAKEQRDAHLGVTFAALQASTIPTWTIVCPGRMIHKAEGAHSFHRTQPEIIDESVAGASLLYSAVAQAYVDVGMELVKMGAKSKYNKVGDSASLEVPSTGGRRSRLRNNIDYVSAQARVAFKGGGRMSWYQLCMTTLIGCPCIF